MSRPNGDSEIPAAIATESSGCTPRQREQRGRESECGKFARRLRAVAMILRGSPRAEAACAQGVSHQTVRDRVTRFSELGPGRRGRPPCGRSCRLKDAQRAELAGIPEAGPDISGDGVRR